jgi:hypothetical protein
MAHSLRTTVVDLQHHNEASFLRDAGFSANH